MRRLAHLSFIAAVMILSAMPGFAQFAQTFLDDGGSGVAVSPTPLGDFGHERTGRPLGRSGSSDADLDYGFGYADRLGTDFDYGFGHGDADLNYVFGYADRLDADLDYRGSGMPTGRGSVTLLPDAPSPTRLLFEREAAPDCWRSPCWVPVLPQRERWQRERWQRRQRRQKSQADFWRSPLHWSYREMQRQQRQLRRSR